MTTPGGVPNLPVGALTLDTLASKTQDMSVSGMRGRADERVSSIFGSSTGGDVTSDLSPLGIITKIFSGFSSVVANADPADIQGPEDLPGLLLDFIESLPVIGELVDLLEAILGTYTGDDETLLTVQAIFAPIRAVVDAIQTAVGGADLSDFFNLDGATSILGAIVNGIGDLINSLVNGGQPINVLNLFGQLTQGLFGVVPASSISSNNPNLLNNGGFDGSISMDGSGVWTYDATTGHTSNGSAMTTADGTLKALLSNAVDVTVGQKLTPTVWVKSSGYAGTGTPIRLAVKTYLAGAAVSGANIASGAGPGGTWTQMSGTFTVPSGVDSVRLRLVVDTTATGGSIWFDDGSLTKPGNGPFDGILQLFGLTALEDLFDGLNIDDIWSAIISVILNPLGLLEDTIGRGDLVNTVDNILDALLGTSSAPSPLSDLLGALQNIPFLNVLGTGGPANIGSTVQATWDQWISGLVGTIGTGAHLADLFNIGQDISSRASKGSDSWDVLGIRNNKPLKTGFLPTSISNINLDKVAIGSTTAVTVPITPTTALMSYHIIEESMPVGAIQWQGYGTTNITGFFVNLYTMNPTTGVCDVLLHNSADIKALLTGGTGPPFPVTYSLPTATDPLLPGTILGVEQVVRGTSAQHNVAGGPTWLQDQVVYPRRWSSVRDSSTTLAPSSITPSYTTTNVPAIEVAVSASPVALPHAPTINPFAASGTIPIPAWCNFIDCVVIGAGGGGEGTGFNLGEGGAAGSWNGVTLTRGTTIPSGTTTMSVTVGTGGAGGLGSGFSADGSAGGSSSVSATGMTTLTAAGGGGGSGDNGATDGLSPGNYTFNSRPYAGGGVQSTVETVGVTPGGGGSGAKGASANGGAGAPGYAWIVFRQ